MCHTGKRCGTSYYSTTRVVCILVVAVAAVMKYRPGGTFRDSSVALFVGMVAVRITSPKISLMTMVADSLMAAVILQVKRL